MTDPNEKTFSSTESDSTNAHSVKQETTGDDPVLVRVAAIFAELNKLKVAQVDLGILQTKRESELIKLQERVKTQRGDIQKINYYLVGIVTVFFFAFLAAVFGLGAIMIDTYRSKEESYTGLGSKVSDLDATIQKLNNHVIWVNYQK